MISFLVILIFFGLPLFIMAVIPARREKSVARFFIAALVAFFAVELPLFIFTASALMAPEAKDVCSHGWLNCWIETKLALLPLALWASAALYAIEVLRVKDRARPWIIHGVFLGALISLVSLIYGMVVFMNPPDEAVMFLVIPGYIGVWYLIRTVQLAKAASSTPGTYLFLTFISLPFWAASVLWARIGYEALPQTGPDCFVVTAAGRGHKSLVGPFYKISRNGRWRRANRQLLTLWEFEARWQSAFPGSHASFRRFYNRIGPVVAAQIRWPWLADLVWLALKPVEWAAGWAGAKLQTKFLCGGVGDRREKRINADGGKNDKEVCSAVIDRRYRNLQEGEI